MCPFSYFFAERIEVVKERGVFLFGFVVADRIGEFFVEEDVNEAGTFLANSHFLEFAFNLESCFSDDRCCFERLPNIRDFIVTLLLFGWFHVSDLIIFNPIIILIVNHRLSDKSKLEQLVNGSIEFNCLVLLASSKK